MQRAARRGLDGKGPLAFPYLEADGHRYYLVKLSDT
jgi:hypothetical protein